MTGVARCCRHSLFPVLTHRHLCVLTREEDWEFMNATLPSTYGTSNWDGSVSAVIGEGKHKGTVLFGNVDNATNCSKVF